MKKRYVLTMALALMAMTLQAQWQIQWQDFMNYSLGPVHEGRWTSWSGNPGPEDMLIVNDGPVVFDGNHGKIDDNGVQDAMLQLGNQTSGIFAVRWFMYIPAGKTAYYNIQEYENPLGVGNWAIEVYFNQNNASPGVGQIYGDGNLLATFNYSEDTLMYLGFDVNLFDDTVKFEAIDGSGNIVYDGPLYSDGGNLGGINFHSVDSNTEFYVDNFQFWVNTLGVDVFSEDSFSYYPNPVSDLLHLETIAVVESIQIYDALEKQIQLERPNSLSPSIDMSNLSSGVYFVTVTMEGASNTIKIIK